MAAKSERIQSDRPDHGFIKAGLDICLGAFMIFYLLLLMKMISLFTLVVVRHAVINWAGPSKFGTYRLCEQRRFRLMNAVSPEPSLLAHTSSESRGTFRQKARSLVPLNGWACAINICHDGMLEDTNLLDSAQLPSSATMGRHSR